MLRDLSDVITIEDLSNDPRFPTEFGIVLRGTKSSFEIWSTGIEVALNGGEWPDELTMFFELEDHSYPEKGSPFWDRLAIEARRRYANTQNDR